MKGELANGVGSQYSSYYLGTWCIQHYVLPLMRTPRLPAVDRTDAPAELNGFVRFAERRNLVSARVPSHFKRSLTLSPQLKDWVWSDLTFGVKKEKEIMGEKERFKWLHFI